MVLSLILTVFLAQSAVAGPAPYADAALEVWKSSLAVVMQDSTKALGLYLHYSNRSSFKIVKESVEVSIFNPAGKFLFKKTFEDSIVLDPLQKFENPNYFSFKNNAFVKDEPADRLWAVAQAGSARIKARVLKVVLEDGTVLLPKPAGKE